MRKFFEFIISTKTLLITIYLFLAQKFLLRGLLNSFRFSEQKYIYEYGILISKGLVYLALVLSFLYPLKSSLLNNCLGLNLDIES